jgi:hypothetical protein
MDSAAETRGRLGIHSHLKSRDQRLTRRFQVTYQPYQPAGRADARRVDAAYGPVRLSASLAHATSL